jgi:hypothetical protein
VLAFNMEEEFLIPCLVACRFTPPLRGMASKNTRERPAVFVRKHGDGSHTPGMVGVVRLSQDSHTSKTHKRDK